MFKIKCPGCGTTYKIRKERLAGRKKITIPCPKCGHPIVLDLPSPTVTGEKPAGPATKSGDWQAATPPREALLKQPPEQAAEDLKARIQASVSDLPPMPQVVMKTLKLISSPNVIMNELSRILETDQAMVSRILRLTNSAYYGRREKISSINKACILLGQQALKELIISAGAANFLERTLKGYGFKSGELWQHSIATALCSRIIAKKKRPDLANDAYTAGLLHDVGKIILDPYVLDKKAEFDAFMNTESGRIIDAEKAIFGFDHADIAADICKNWNIPEDVAIAIQHHHRPSASHGNELAYIAHAADYVAKLSGLGYESDDIMAELEDGTTDLIGLDREALGDLVLEVIESVQKISSSFR